MTLLSPPLFSTFSTSSNSSSSSTSPTSPKPWQYQSESDDKNKSEAVLNEPTPDANKTQS
ncbi:hypothetical protein LTS18_003441, partial [Coniosporium uncinatum]